MTPISDVGNKCVQCAFFRQFAIWHEPVADFIIISVSRLLFGPLFSIEMQLKNETISYCFPPGCSHSSGSYSSTPYSVACICHFGIMVMTQSGLELLPAISIICTCTMFLFCLLWDDRRSNGRRDSDVDDMESERINIQWWLSFITSWARESSSLAANPTERSAAQQQTNTDSALINERWK